MDKSKHRQNSDKKDMRQMQKENENIPQDKHPQ